MKTSRFLSLSNLNFTLLHSLYSDVGTLLDQKFRAAYNLTYFTMGGYRNVDTSKFRRAIWNYIQCIYGIRHDDYDYGEVNQVNKCVRVYPNFFSAQQYKCNNFNILCVYVCSAWLHGVGRASAYHHTRAKVLRSICLQRNWRVINSREISEFNRLSI